MDRGIALPVALQGSSGWPSMQGGYVNCAERFVQQGRAADAEKPPLRYLENSLTIFMSLGAPGGMTVRCHTQPIMA